MALNVKCPKCGSTHVQVSQEKSKHGFFWFLIFGIWFIFERVCKMVIGLFIFMCYDWWMAIIKKIQGKGHVWQCKKWISGKKRIYYCHDCGYNFRA